MGVRSYSSVLFRSLSVQSRIYFCSAPASGRRSNVNQSWLGILQSVPVPIPIHSLLILLLGLSFHQFRLFRVSLLGRWIGKKQFVLAEDATVVAPWCCRTSRVKKNHLPTGNTLLHWWVVVVVFGVRPSNPTRIDCPDGHVTASDMMRSRNRPSVLRSPGSGDWRSYVSVLLASFHN